MITMSKVLAEKSDAGPPSSTGPAMAPVIVPPPFSSCPVLSAGLSLEGRSRPFFFEGTTECQIVVYNLVRVHSVLPRCKISNIATARQWIDPQCRCPLRLPMWSSRFFKTTEKEEGEDDAITQYRNKLVY